MAPLAKGRRPALFAAMLIVAAVLALLAAGAATASFPGRPGFIFFDDAPTSEGCEGQIFSADPRTEEPQEIATGAEPKVSPDGKRIVYTTCVGIHSAISVMKADGSDPQVVISGDFSAGEPSFSPDGRGILYTRSESPESLAGIWAANVDGSHRRQLLTGARGGKHPSYSPNGRLIVFAYRNLIFTMRPDGRRLRPLTPGAAPSISPDGRTVVYSRDGGIWTIRIDGSQIRRLNRQYSSGQHERVKGGHVRNVSPTWSPDGRLILFGRVGNRGIPSQRSHLWTMRPDGSEMERIDFGAAEPIAAYRPDWQARP